MSDTHHASVDFNIETNGVNYKIVITEGATRHETVVSRSELRKLLVDLYHEVGPETSDYEPYWDGEDDEE